jgi:hypothetical protein
MPYDPGISSHVDQIILHAGDQLQGDIRSEMEDYKKTKDQNEFNSGAFETILNNPATRGAIPPELIGKFQTLSPNAASGALAQIFANIKNQREVQQQATEIDALKGVRAATATNLTSEATNRDALTQPQVNQTNATTGNITSETTTRDTLRQPQVKLTQAQTFAENIRGLLGIQQGEKLANLAPAQFETLPDPSNPKKLLGYKITQPDGTVHVTTIPNGLDINSLMAAMGGAGGGGGAVAPSGAPAATGAAAPAPAPAAAPRIRVKGPQGQTGTAAAGATLPAGWVQIP